jgi:hypothetical protein
MAHFLILHIKERKVCENFEMRIKIKWKVHENFKNKSYHKINNVNRNEPNLEFKTYFGFTALTWHKF